MSYWKEVIETASLTANTVPTGVIIAERGGHSALPVVKREEQEFAGVLFIERGSG